MAIYKVTLKLYLPEYEGGPWIDGPVQYMGAETLQKFSQEHSYFKVETANIEDLPDLKWNGFTMTYDTRR